MLQQYYTDQMQTKNFVFQKPEDEDGFLTKEPCQNYK
jgi:hypothetical protein